MLHLGDITKMNGYDIPPVDCIVGGSPCQDLSVAGKRQGLAGERSGLFMEQIRIVKEMRDNDRRNNKRTGQYIRPRWMVWENVTGALSSGSPKGADFAAVLEEIIKVAEQTDNVCVRVPERGWTKAGCFYAEDGGWSIAWRVHDAQFWGVPQRRKRIALVADFGGLGAPEVLFERKGVSRDIEPSRETGEGSSRDSAECPNDTSISFQERAGCDGGGKGILIQNDRVGTLSTLNNQSVLASTVYGFDPQAARYVGCHYEETATTLKPCTMQWVFGEIHRPENKPQTIVLEGNGTRASHNGDGYAESDTMFTLNTVERHAVLYDAYQHHGWRENETTGTLTVGQNNTVRGDTPLVLCEQVDNDEDGN